MPGSYHTILVHLEIGQSNTRRLRVVHDLAVRHHATVIGIGVGQPLQIAYGDGYVYPDLIEEDRGRLDAALSAAAAEFHAMFAGHTAPEWRSFVVFTSLADKVASEARCADLIVTGTALPTAYGEPRRMITGDLVMQAGRPVLVVPDGDGTPSQRRIVIGWMDTREARRAIHDALPLLQAAEHVWLVQVAEAEEPGARLPLDDMVTWLARHGVAAKPLLVAASGEDHAQLDEVARAHDADLIVAGAYGHSRVREWALGGMTRALLHQGSRCTLLSH